MSKPSGPAEREAIGRYRVTRRLGQGGMASCMLPTTTVSSVTWPSSGSATLPDIRRCASACCAKPGPPDASITPTSAMSTSSRRRGGSSTSSWSCWRARHSSSEAVGPGACVRNGGVRFTKFLQLLGQHQKVGAWHFAPTSVNARVGQELFAVNRGGEDHTFTEVESSGAGSFRTSSQVCRCRRRSASRSPRATSSLPAGQPPMTSKRRAPSCTSAASIPGRARS
jgi:hypothetical protein